MNENNLVNIKPMLPPLDLDERSPQRMDILHLGGSQLTHLENLRYVHGRTKCC